jgi:hypothetical protein
MGAICPPPGDTWQWLETFLVFTTEGTMLLAACEIKARDGPRCPTMCRTSPTTENDPIISHGESWPHKILENKNQDRHFIKSEPAPQKGPGFSKGSRNLDMSKPGLESTWSQGLDFYLHELHTFPSQLNVFCLLCLAASTEGLALNT